MSSEPETPVKWVPPAKVEDLFAVTSNNKFASINRPTAGARDERDYPEGNAPVQLYSLATPNGVKASILFEELIEAGCDLEYDAHRISIGKGDQFTSFFTEVNPNGKIPAAVDNYGTKDSVNLFESGSICWYFAEKYNKFIPESPALKAQVMNWVMWQMGGQGPMTGQFGHFFVYAPADKCETRDYGTARYGMETMRLCDVLDKALKGKEWLVGDEISLADLIIYPWINQLKTGYAHDSGITANTFIEMDRYENINTWYDKISLRPGVIRGLQVCHWNHDSTKPWLEEK